METEKKYEKYTATKEKHNLPLKKFRVGAISATIWENQGKSQSGEAVSFKNVSFERNYKDAKGDWQSTTALRQGDLPKAILVLNKAYEYLSFNSAAAEAE
jgi:hypothetical protein